MERLHDHEQHLSVTDILSGAQSVSRGLEALRIEQQKHISEVDDSSTEYEEEDEMTLHQCRKERLFESVDRLQAGIQEANLLLTVTSYINSLEADRAKLKAQVRRVCDENSWLKQEIAKLQQILTDTEVELVKAKEEKAQLEILGTVPICVSDGKSFITENVNMEKGKREEVKKRDEELDHAEIGNVETATDGTKIDSGCHSITTDSGRFQKLHQRAINHMNQGRHDVAVSLCKKAAQEMEHSLGRHHPDRASILNVTVLIYREQGKLKDAIKLLQEVLEIREKCFGKNHQSVASTLNNLSVLFAKSSQYRMAEPLCRRALEIKQEVLGAHHPDVAQQLINLASICQHLGNYEEVEWYYQRALEIYQTEFGSEDQNVIKTMNYLGKCYMKQGKLEAAEAIFKKVRSIVQVQDTPVGSREHSVSPTWLGRDSPDVSSHPSVPAPLASELSITGDGRKQQIPTGTRQVAPDSSSQNRQEQSVSIETAGTGDGSGDSTTTDVEVKLVAGGSGGSIRSSVSANVLRFFKWGSDNSST